MAFTKPVRGHASATGNMSVDVLGGFDRRSVRGVGLLGPHAIINGPRRFYLFSCSALL